MCGRFTLITSADDLTDAFGPAGPFPALATLYNVAPGQVVAVVGRKPDGTSRGLARLRRGLVPRWAADPAAGPKPIIAGPKRSAPARRSGSAYRRGGD